MSKYILINFIQDLKACRESKTYFLSSLVSNKLAIDNSSSRKKYTIIELAYLSEQQYKTLTFVNKTLEKI